MPIVGLAVWLPALAVGCRSAPAPEMRPSKPLSTPSDPLRFLTESRPLQGELLLPGPAPRPPASPDGLSERSCAPCHAEIAAEWDASLHHRSFENAYFARAYSLEKTAFCRKCHAPSADPGKEPPEAARALGVGCLSCHGSPRGIVGIVGSEGSANGHPVVGDSRLATTLACGGCHQFDFPHGPGQPKPMQNTLEEHKLSSYSDLPCQDCHMKAVTGPNGRSHRDHRFRVQGDPEMMAQAVRVESVRFSRGEARLSIAPGKIGHSFPTGDLFRQVEVRAFPLDGAGRPLPMVARETLGRRFRIQFVNTSAAARETRDSRLTGPREVKLSLPLWARRAKWQIVWQRLPRALADKLALPWSPQEFVAREGTVER